MIKVLHELGNLDGGGVARLLYNYYCHMNKERIHFDFLIYDFFKEGILEEPLKELGCTIYKIPTMQEDKKKCFDNMKNIIKGNYDIVPFTPWATSILFSFMCKEMRDKKKNCSFAFGIS